MSREYHVRFCEQLGVKLPRLTRLADSTDGAEATSLLYSLVITAKLNGKDPFKVMVEIFNRLPAATTTMDDYEALADLITT